MYGLPHIRGFAAETHDHGREVMEFIVNDFYMDDGLKSCPTGQEAIEFISKLKLR